MNIRLVKFFPTEFLELAVDDDTGTKLLGVPVDHGGSGHTLHYVITETDFLAVLNGETSISTIRGGALHHSDLMLPEPVPHQAKTPRETVESWLRYLAKGLYTADDVAMVIEDQIAASGDLTLFQLAPPEVMAAMREHVALFLQHGSWALSGGGSPVDQTRMMLRFSESMRRAGLLDDGPQPSASDR